MKTFAALLASVAVRRPALLVAGALFLLVASILVIEKRAAFDSEILNLLPAGTPAVEGLRLYNEHFNSSRELAFVLESSDSTDPDAEARFVENLRAQPWVLRVLDGPPTDSPDGRATLPELVAPLLLGQTDDVFEQTLARLDANAIENRIAGLAYRVAAGSPLARFELENDPLGIVAPAAADLSSKLAVAETFDLLSGSTRIVPIITTQTDLSADACRELMTQVHAFLAAEQSREGAPRLSVTGRAAYVDEISSSMQRDITTTSAVSLAAVTVLFWFAFRSFLPLVGAVLILGFTCIVSLAAGTLVFDRLNVVAMGFCSILIGLGDDFSLLCFQRFLGGRAEGQNREQAIATSVRLAAPGIFWVALTTSLGFATLIFSGSAGFGQLGILIGVGVIIGALAMVFLMPLFERSTPPVGGADPIRDLCARFLHPRCLTAAGLLLLAAIVLALVPWRALRFDTSTASLEPRNIPAAAALQRLMTAFPAMFEPVMIVVPAPARSSDLRALDARLDEFRTEGVLAGYSSPSPLIADADQRHRNLAALQALDWDGLERAVLRAESTAGLQPGALDSAIRLLRSLSSDQPLEKRLPPASPWWFVLDRTLSPETGDVIYYLRLKDSHASEQRTRLEAAVQEIVPDAMITGWSQMLHDLVPWATRELATFGTLVVVIILVILLVTYRNLRLLALHAAALALAMAGTVASLKLANQPINLLNVLAFPLILAIGVDYGVHLILATKEPGDPRTNLSAVMKPVFISGLTTMSGFGALVFAQNPALSGLGLVCATGVAWSLFASLAFLSPLLLPRPPRG